MPQSLVVEVCFHEGRYHGQADGFSGVGGWPPSPGRLFQAFVAAAARGAHLREEDVAALVWLETLDPPCVAAPVARRGRPVKLYVPGNDLDSVDGDPNRTSKVRHAKTWRPSFFDHDQPVIYAWDFDSGARKADRICVLAARLYQLGRGIDMAWARAHVVDRDKADGLLASHCGSIHRPTGNGETATPTQGTLQSLVTRYARSRYRLTTVDAGGKAQQLFTKPPLAVFGRVGYGTPARRLGFELRTTKGAFSPQPLSAASPLVIGLVKGATRRLQTALPAKGVEFERLVLGRGAGPADLEQRIRLVPIPSVGTEHTDLSIRRVLVEVPAACPIPLGDLAWAFKGLGPFDPRTGEAWLGRLVSTDDLGMADRFSRHASRFRSVTPLALSGCLRGRNRIAKNARERVGDERRVVGAVVQALRHAGIPTNVTDIRVQKEPFHKRALRAESFAAGSRFSRRALWHTELRFQERITGPIVIGDGRFQGLGLMEPITRYGDVFSFDLGVTRRIRPEDRVQLIRYFRRALMSLANDEAGGVERLFSGHEPDGGAARGGHHAHVFLAADGATGHEPSIKRVIVAAPWAIDRNARSRPGARQRFEEVTRQLKELRAGRLGRFDHLVARPILDGDPLIRPARTWISETPYLATRNLKKHQQPREAVRGDVATECRRRGLPTPKNVKVLDVRVGRRGGRPTAALRLTFATAVRGPLLLGRDSHFGGGLFAGVRSDQV